MEKTIAVVTQKGSLSRGVQQNTIINLFKLTNDKVTGVENVNMEEVSEKSFSLMLALKQVSVVYLGTISNELRRILDTIGITTKLKGDLDNDKFKQQFIFY